MFQFLGEAASKKQDLKKQDMKKKIALKCL
jgi:hypothetical protein